MTTAQDVERERDRAIWKAAEVLGGHFAMRPWVDLASNRGDLRRLVRSRNYDVNEPTRDDLLAAARDAVAAYLAHLSAQPQGDQR